VKAGADSFWECFDADDSRKSPYGDCHNDSCYHAWSCAPSYLLRVLLRVFLGNMSCAEGVPRKHELC